MSFVVASFCSIFVLSFSSLTGVEGVCTYVNPTDLVFLLDGSGSTCDTDPGYVYLRDKTCNNWKSVVQFVYGIVNNLNIGPDAVMVSVIIFQTGVKIPIQLNQYQTKPELLNAINNLPYIGGDTYTTLGLQTMRTNVFSQPGDRQSAANFAVIITDGNPTVGVEGLQNEINLDLAAGITLAAVGVTNAINETILKSMSSPPQQKDVNYFMSPDFQSISSISQRLEVYTFCPSEAPLLNQTTSGDPCITTPLFSDIGFAVDASGSICDTDPTFNIDTDNTCNNWALIINFMKSLVSALTIGPDANRIAVVVFSNYAYLAFKLDDFNDQASVLNAIDQLKYEKSGNTDTTDGLNLLRTKVFGQSGDRQGYLNLCITITDGYPTSKINELQGEIDLMKAAGTRMIAVGVTNEIDELMLSKLSSAPQQKGITYFTAPDFQSLSTIISAFQTQVLCPSVTPPAPILSPEPCQDTTSTVNDIGLLIDVSGSICDTDPNYVFGRNYDCDNFENLKTFLKNFVSSGNTNNNRYGLVIFRSNATVLRLLNSNTPIINDIDRLRYDPGGDTATTEGLFKMRTEVFGKDGDRPDVPNVVVIVTDGRPTINVAGLDGELAAYQAAGVKMVAVGVTDSIDESTLRRLSSPPQQRGKDYFVSTGFDTISAIQSDLAVQVLCPPSSTNGPILGPTTTPGIVCEMVNKTELVFAMDNSGSICDSDPNYRYPNDKTCTNWRLMVEFVINIILGLPVGPDLMRFGIVTFHTYAEVVIRLDEFLDKASLINAIRTRVVYVGGDTATAAGLRVVRNQVLSSQYVRPNVNKVCVIITDGIPTIEPSQLPNEESLNQAAGITTVAVGITNSIDFNTLRMLGSPPHELNKEVFTSPDFTSVNLIRENLIKATFCPGT